MTIRPFRPRAPEGADLSRIAGPRGPGPDQPARRRLLAAGGAGLLLAGSALPVAPALAEESAPAYAAWSATTRGNLSDLDYLVLCATLAPNPHNTQPWKFRVDKGHVDVLLDRERGLGAADAEGRMRLMGIGCAIENLAIAAQRIGLRARFDGAANPAEGHCASLAIVPGTTVNHPWFGAIFRRQTTRSRFDPTVQPPSSLVSTLARQSDLPGVRLTWFDTGAQAQAVTALVKASVRDFVASDARHGDGTRWFRRTRAEWEARRDGIAIYQNDVPFFVREYVERFTSEQDMLGKEFRQGEIDGIDKLAPDTARWGLVSAEAVSPELRVRAGRYAERVYLEATSQGFGVQPICYPTELAGPAAELAKLAGLGSGAEPLFLFRLGKSDFRARSVRRALSDVIVRA